VQILELVHFDGIEMIESFAGCEAPASVV